VLAGDSHDGAAGDLLICGVRVFDGTRLAPADSVLIHGGLITQVGTGLTAPPGARTVGGAGCTLLPGLIDGHVHAQRADNLAQALAAATSVPASCFGLTDRGRISPGLRADLLLVDGDPTADITATRDIRAIWRSGTEFDRDTYRAQLANAQPR